MNKLNNTNTKLTIRNLELVLPQSTTNQPGDKQITKLYEYSELVNGRCASLGMLLGILNYTRTCNDIIDHDTIFLFGNIIYNFKYFIK